MGLFSKETCDFCGKEAGMLGRKKLADKKYICKECEKNCSAFLDVSRFGSDYLKVHMEYMEKQNELYNKEFDSLDKSKKDRIVHEGYYGIVFADDIAMFEVIDPKAKKKNYNELFRYDQIKDYELYTKQGTGENAKKYSEVGVKITMRSKIGLDAVGSSGKELKGAHPYVSELYILCDKNTDTTSSTSLIIGHLNKIFGRASNTVAGAIKESIVGTEHEKQGYKAGTDALKALGSFAKAKVRGDEEAEKDAKEKLDTAIESGMEFATESRSKYKKIADDVEKRALGDTIADLF